MAAPQPKGASTTVLLRAVDLGAAEKPPTPDGVHITQARRVQPGAGVARAGGKPTTVAVQSDELVRVEYENGIRLWMRADDLLRERGQASTQRSAGAEPVWDIDTAPKAGVFNATPASRGMVGIGIKVLEFFGVEISKEVAGRAAAVFEARQLGLAKDQAPGLYRTRLVQGAVLQAAPLAAQLPIDRPLLVFLHGTMSSVHGSFGALEAPAESAPAGFTSAGAAVNAGSVDDHANDTARRDTRAALLSRYGEHLYAFEHLSLTQSPVANALDLVNSLPKGAELHLVSHSRGGLVGELLCLGQRDRANDPLVTGIVEQLFDTDRTIAPQLGLVPLPDEQKAARNAAYAADLQKLRDLLAALDDKQLRITRFVRVACPARGTTLASGRLDRWLSVLDLLASHTLFGEAADFLLSVLKQRTDPRTMPGIEAMLPGSALTRLLQLPGLTTRADLSVIAGDVEGQSFWGSVKLLAADWFYGSEHDLVVNTGSMSGGLKRAVGDARWLEDSGPQVTHFRYFTNATSLRWLLAGLTRTDAENGGFGAIEAARADEPRWRSAVATSRAAATPRPIVVVVPGTMGSALDAGNRPVWLNYWALLRGGLADIGWDAAGVEPVDLISAFYGPLLEHLAREHRVEILPYDWRRSVRDSAADLARLLKRLLPEAEATGMPLHIVAHSLGGLLGRSMIADGGEGAELWKRMGQLKKPGRLLMLGTPNRGSYEAVRWLTGFNPTQAKLSLLDLRHDVNGIVDIVRRFPGMAELLPFDAASGAFSKVETWRRLKRDVDLRLPLIEQSVLDDAGTTWARLLAAPADPARMHYVAGCHHATVIDVRASAESEIPGPRRLDWVATTEGDGTVSWASGRLDGVAIHYAERTAHDELCSNIDDRRIFRAYVDLLGSGRTDQLATTPPVQRGAKGAATTFVLPPMPVADSIPDEHAVALLNFSGRKPDSGGPRVTTPQIAISVCHGDLSYARHAVLVGHYEGDTIVSAEAAIDSRLNGALMARRDLGLYPGRKGSHAVFRNPDPGRSPSGAVVVGLGAVGDLGAGQLQAGVRDAMLEYALRVAQDAAVTSAGGSVGSSVGGSVGAGASAGASRVQARLSCLLVGSGGGGLAVRESVESILRGAIDANSRLVDTGLDSRVLITEIEFIELYEDLAIGAARAMGHAMAAEDIENGVRWSPPTLRTGQGGRLRRSYDSDRAWDQRIEIIEDTEADMLRFNVTTNRARSEDTLSTGQLALADLFVQQAGSSTVADMALSSTLFELLLPPTFKEIAPDQRDMVLVVDERSARFPWELLHDQRSPNNEPVAIQSGIVRQLKTADFRLRPVHSTDDTALVIGNPDLGANRQFPPLPGARAEAEAVRDKLLSRWAAHDVEALIDAEVAPIVAALHSKPWRVLHLAGHGEHRWQHPVTGKLVSGMVIGDGVFLTPGDIQQMRSVPELVFINCCHLGKTLAVAPGADGPAVDAARQPPPFAALAANLGAQFVRMGVRAVVCAGWAVDDDAATTFASHFYDQLLSGCSFRDAVKAARRSTWELHKGSNTWGAYQCYGDPSWRLSRNAASGDRSVADDYVTVTELVADLANLAESARVESMRGGIAADPLRKRQQRAIEAIKQRAPTAVREAWLARAEVAEALGFAYGEALMLPEAIQALEGALVAHSGHCRIRAAEQSANFKVRQAAEEAARLR